MKKLGSNALSLPKFAGRVQIVSQPQAFFGYVFGFRQPVLRYSLLIPDVDEAQLAYLACLGMR